VGDAARRETQGATRDDEVTQQRDGAQIAARIAEIPEWYHTIEVAPGVRTPGWFDTRAASAELPLPVSLEGKRCLDVGTFDGFWAFEMERRGAKEVIAIDLLKVGDADWPVGSSTEAMDAMSRRKEQGDGFLLVHDALGSTVQRREMNVYDLDPSEVGTFDYVYVGSLLLHLRDPVRAIERVRSVCDGEALFVDAIDLALSLALPRKPVAHLDGLGRPWWWKPNVAGLVRMVESGGFDPIGRPHRFYMTPGEGQPLPRVRLKQLRTATGRDAAITAWRGDPHAAVRARPRR
jgi:tRNA (mo5U34)-methyltransferase